MKTKVITKKAKKTGNKYPCLMIGTETESIYLFTSGVSCILLHNNSKFGDRVGDTFTNQNTVLFKPFEGVLKMRN